MQILNKKYELLNLVAQQYKAIYTSAQPFPNIYFDDFFDTAFLDTVYAEFPNLDRAAEDEYYDANQFNKRTLSKYETMGIQSRKLIDFLHSAIFLQFLQQLTGIQEPLIPDPYLEGGGFHETLSGGFLKLHVDFNKHYRTKLDRRINLLIFLNKNWKEEYGGALELWDESLSKSNIELLPIYNRIAIFNTTSTSFHGHPNKINCPKDITRKSIALYYYSNGRPKNEILEGLEEHSTIFKGRTPQEILAAKKALVRYRRKQFFWSLIPPILFKIRRKILGIN